MKKENTVNYAMILAIILPFVIFGIFMTSQGKSAVNVYIDMIKTVIINKYGFCEVVIKWAISYLPERKPFASGENAT